MCLFSQTHKSHKGEKINNTSYRILREEKKVNNGKGTKDTYCGWCCFQAHKWQFDKCSEEISFVMKFTTRLRLSLPVQASLSV